MSTKENEKDCAFSEPLCEERHARIDAVTDRFLERIVALEVCTVKLTHMVEHYVSQLVCHESRLATLEQKPASRMERIIWYALCALLGAAATAIADWWIAV